MDGLSKIYGRQTLKYLKGYNLLKGDHDSSNFLKAVFSQILIGPFLNSLPHMSLPSPVSP